MWPFKEKLKLPPTKELPDSCLPISARYCEHTNTICVMMKTGNEQKIADIRGWGYLTGTGSLNLTRGQAAAIQRAWGIGIAKAINKKIKDKK